MNNLEAVIADLEWFYPPERKSEFMITIPNDKCFNLNQNLRLQIEYKVGIAKTSDGKALCLREKENGYKIPKSGTVHPVELIAAITKSGIPLPAKYKATKQGGDWFGKYLPPVAPDFFSSGTPKRPRKKGLEAMLKK